MSCGYSITNSQGETVGHILVWIPKTLRTKVSGTTYGGQYYSQTVGSPCDQADIKIYAVSTAEVAALNRAEACGEPLTVCRMGVRYTGYIGDSLSWTDTVTGRLYECSGVFIIASSEVIP